MSEISNEQKAGMSQEIENLEKFLNTLFYVLGLEVKDWSNKEELEEVTDQALNKLKMLESKIEENKPVVELLTKVLRLDPKTDPKVASRRLKRYSEALSSHLEEVKKESNKNAEGLKKLEEMEAQIKADVSNIALSLTDSVKDDIFNRAIVKNFNDAGYTKVLSNSVLDRREFAKAVKRAKAISKKNDTDAKSYSAILNNCREKYKNYVDQLGKSEAGAVIIKAVRASYDTKFADDDNYNKLQEDEKIEYIIDDIISEKSDYKHREVLKDGVVKTGITVALVLIAAGAIAAGVLVNGNCKIRKSR